MNMEATRLDHSVDRQRRACRNMIAIASGKGGVGKTWLSIALSHALARLGHSTVLFDGDLGLANVDVQLGLAPHRDIGGLLAGRYDLDEVASRYHDGGFDIIAGRSGSGALAQLGPGQLAALSNSLQAISRRYDRVVIDLGAGVERTVRRLAGLAGKCLVVATDEPTSLTDAYAFIKLCALDERAAPLSIVVNMASSQRDGERTYATLRKACDSFLKITPPLAGIVRYDARVKDAIRNQSSLLQRHPSSEASHDVEALARMIAADGQSARR